jgi:hypothetical protein
MVPECSAALSERWNRSRPSLDYARIFALYRPRRYRL